MKDVTGRELTEAQAKLVGCYETLRGVLREHRATLAPFEERNAVKAMACLWQVMNGLDMDPGHPYDVGV